MLNLDDFRVAAEQNMTLQGFDYYRSGAHDEITLSKNHTAFQDIDLHYRVMVDVSQRDLRTKVLGQELSLPILVAPTAFHQLATPDGEIATAQAAQKSGTIMTLSTLSNKPVEDVAKACSKLWFQLYAYKDRGATKALVQRAEKAGCRALVLTVDAPFLGVREADVRNNFQLPPGFTVANLSGDPNSLPNVEGSGLAGYFSSLIDPSLTWNFLDWLREITDLPLVVKGIVRADDALKAVERGCDGIVVSNHGGRQLDTSPATISVLPSITKAIKGRLNILLDGGIRRGTDVVKALAYGADAVFVGRPILWGLGSSGSDGAYEVIELFRREIDLAMALCGCPSISDITRDLVEP